MALILLIDDEIEACKAMEEYLTAKGHRVIMAHEGKTAIEKAKEISTDMAILDIIMPGTSGIEILKQLKEITPDIKVIMVTVVNNEEQIVKSFELGAQDFITKSLDFGRLEKVLNSLTENT